VSQNPKLLLQFNILPTAAQLIAAAAA